MIEQLRAGTGPVLVEARVVRLDPHSNSDDHRKYRGAEEILRAATRDPLLIMERDLLEAGILNSAGICEVKERIREEVNRAADQADARPQPSAAMLMADIFSAAPDCEEAADRPEISSEPVTMIDAINHGLREEMQRNPKIVRWGEDIAGSERRRIRRHPRSHGCVPW